MSLNDKPQQDVKKPWWFPGWPRLPALRDVVTHVIALGVLGYTGVVLWDSLLRGTDEGLRHAREVLCRARHSRWRRTWLLLWRERR